MSDLATLLKQQMEGTIARSLDAAVASGDTQAARAAAKQFADLQVASVPKTSPAKKPPTSDEVKAALSAKLDWFGIDPRKSAKIAEIGRNMLPERFDTAEAFADALIKTYNDEEKAANKTTEEEEEPAEEEAVEEEEPAERKPARRNGTQQPELNAGARQTVGSNLRRAYETGDIKFLPRAAADDVKRSASKFAANSTDKQKEAFIRNAVKTRARGDLIATGKFDPKTSTFK